MPHSWSWTRGCEANCSSRSRPSRTSRPRVPSPRSRSDLAAAGAGEQHWSSTTSRILRGGRGGFWYNQRHGSAAGPLSLGLRRPAGTVDLAFDDRIDPEVEGGQMATGPSSWEGFFDTSEYYTSPPLTEAMVAAA